MLNELLQEKGYLSVIALLKDNSTNKKFYLLNITEKPFTMEEEGMVHANSFLTSCFKNEEFYILKENNVVEKSTFILDNEEDFEKHRYTIDIFPTQVSNKEISLSLEDDIVYIQSTDDKTLAINLYHLGSYEEKENIRIIRGFTMETASDISLDDIRSNAGNNMMLKAMNAIVSKKVAFNNFEVIHNADIYEGDIITIVYENHTKETGMLLYDYIQHEYILKQINRSLTLRNSSSSKVIKKIKLEKTFLEAQTSTMGTAILAYFTEEECSIIHQYIFNCEAISLGMGSLLSLIKDPDEVDFIFENVITNGLDKEGIDYYIHPLIENQPFTILPELPYINFIYLT